MRARDALLQRRDKAGRVLRQAFANDGGGAARHADVCRDRAVLFCIGKRDGGDDLRLRASKICGRGAARQQHLLQALNRRARAAAGRVQIDAAGGEAPHDAGGGFRPLQITPEPEQIVGGAAWQIAEHAHHAHGFARWQQR